MKLFDYHLHSRYSYDCGAYPDDICRYALKNGLSGFILTEHIELDDVDGMDHRADFPALSEELERLRLKYPALTMGAGAEMGLGSHLTDRLVNELDRYEWDFVLGSAHIIDGLAVYNGEFSAQREQEEVFPEYLRKVYQLIKTAPRFDVLAHIDLIRRDVSCRRRPLTWRDFPDELDAILKVLAGRGMGLEVNTASTRYGLDCFHPHISVLKRFRELGGEVVTCGSDAHDAKWAGFDIKAGYELLKKAGFKYITLFSKRKPMPMPL